MDHIFFLLLKTPSISVHFGFQSLQRGSGFPAVTYCTQLSIERSFSNLAFGYFLKNALKVPYNKWQVKQSKALFSPFSPFLVLHVGGIRKEDLSHECWYPGDCCWVLRGAPIILWARCTAAVRSLGWVSAERPVTATS